MKASFFSRHIDVLLLATFAWVAQGGANAPDCLRVHAFGNGVIGPGTESQRSIAAQDLSPTACAEIDKESGAATVKDPVHGTVRFGKGNYGKTLLEAQKLQSRVEKLAAPSTVQALTVAQKADDPSCMGVSKGWDLPSVPKTPVPDGSVRDHRGSHGDHRGDHRAPAGSAPPKTPDAPGPVVPPPAAEPPTADTGIPSPTEGGPTSQSGNNIYIAYGSARQAAELARGNDVVEAARKARLAMESAADQDDQVLSKPYRDSSLEKLAERLQRSANYMSENIDNLRNSAQTSLDSSERARFTNYFLNARDMAQLGLDAVHDDQKERENQGLLGTTSPFLGLISGGGKGGDNPLAKTAALAAVFGDAGGESDAGNPRAPAGSLRIQSPLTPSGASASSVSGLSQRMLKFGGLDEDERKQAEERLKLLERTRLTRRDGKQVTVDLLHNGYILGGGTTGLDCSSFVSSVLPADIRRGQFTTLDFRTMWIYAKTQVFPDQPKYTDDRAKLVKNTSNAFIPIDIYNGARLTVGDLLVYRFINDPIGHIVIVQSYNHAALRAEIIEASQSAGKIRERPLELSADPLTSRRREIVPGIWALRLKPASNKGCSYRGETVREPASTPVNTPAAAVVNDVPEGAAR